MTVDCYDRYYFPKQLLSSHFWSLQQRQDFAMLDLKMATRAFRPTFRSMQARISSVEQEQLRDKLSDILSKLACGVHPTVEEVLEIKILFQGEPFHLNCLYPRHKVTKETLACSGNPYSKLLYRLSSEPIA